MGKHLVDLVCQHADLPLFHGLQIKDERVFLDPADYGRAA
jgi:hypothetical protein